MIENQQIQMGTYKTERYDDEIELIDILRVIWKWKYLIVGGTFVCGLIAAIVSFNMSKIYSIDMVMRPGILSVGSEGQNVYTNSSQNMVLNLRDQGKNVYIDDAENIKALIESGTFNHDIFNYLKENKMNRVPRKLEFKVNIPKGSDTIKVTYETDDIKKGMVIQNHLGKLLFETYRELVQYFKNEYEMKLDILKSELDYIKVAIQSYKRNVKNIEKRIDELNSEIKLIKNNTSDLIREREKLLSKNPKENNILSALLYTNTIQQNLGLSNNYQNEVNDYKLKKEEGLQKIEESQKEIANKINEIKSLQFKKDNIQNIRILQPPTSSLYPVKPKKMLIIVLSTFLGLFFMLFLSFLLEFVSRHKENGLTNTD